MIPIRDESITEYLFEYNWLYVGWVEYSDNINLFHRFERAIAAGFLFTRDEIDRIHGEGK